MCLFCIFYTMVNLSIHDYQFVIGCFHTHCACVCVLSSKFPKWLPFYDRPCVSGVCVNSWKYERKSFLRPIYWHSVDPLSKLYDTRDITMSCVVYKYWSSYRCQRTILITFVSSKILSVQSWNFIVIKKNLDSVSCTCVKRLDILCLDWLVL